MQLDTANVFSAQQTAQNLTLQSTIKMLQKKISDLETSHTMTLEKAMATHEREVEELEEKIAKLEKSLKSKVKYQTIFSHSFLFWYLDILPVLYQFFDSTIFFNKKIC
jgi:hypothetical protein